MRAGVHFSAIIGHMFEGDGAEGAVAAIATTLARLDQCVVDSVRIDRLRALEEAKSVIAAAQAREAVALAASQRSEQLSHGVRAEHADRGVATQIGLALRISPWQPRRYLGWARILTTELPQTYSALRSGHTTERRALVVARETVWLSREHRRSVDEQLAPRLEQLGDRRVEAEARTIAYRLDPSGYVERARIAERERRVSLRPAPDTMTRLTALVPLAQGVAAYAALCLEADGTVAAGDERGRGQIMPDTLVERVTGQSRASDVPVEINLVMTDRALLSPFKAGGDEPALVDGADPIPAGLARQLVSTVSDETSMWLRRLFTAPRSGELIAMESGRRSFTPAQRRFLRIRDRYCRTPWCGAPIRHADHVIPAADGGGTTISNGQGYCEACNHGKQAPGWRTQVVPGTGTHQVEIRTPTGHRYRSRAPDPPRAA